jgi:hypothetical protein
MVCFDYGCWIVGSKKRIDLAQSGFSHLDIESHDLEVSGSLVSSWMVLAPVFILFKT